MAGDTVRVVTWNVRSLRDDASGVATALRELRPDLVCVQEAPRLALWRLSRRRLARRAGLALATRTRACGNLLLSGPRVRLLGAYDVLLPRRPGLHRRAGVAARVVVDGRELVLAGTHLDLDPAARLDSARRLRAALPGLPARPDLPLVICGDVNEQADGPAWQELARGLVDAGEGLGPTYSVRDPQRRLDAVLVDPALEVLECRVVPTGPVSDHFAVCADLRWRG